MVWIGKLVFVWVLVVLINVVLDIDWVVSGVFGFFGGIGGRVVVIEKVLLNWFLIVLGGIGMWLLKFGILELVCVIIGLEMDKVCGVDVVVLVKMIGVEGGCVEVELGLLFGMGGFLRFVVMKC